MTDTTETFRRQEVQNINGQVQTDNAAIERARLEEQYGKGNVWNTTELQARFQVISFAAPYCVVKERGTGKQGVVAFQHSPRFYFQFTS